MSRLGGTFFVRSAADLARQLREAELDHAAFERPLRRCELACCRATCCHDGVVVGDEELTGISEVVVHWEDRLAEYGWREPEAGGFVPDQRNDWRTATRPAETGELADDFPAHFPRTRCVFLDAEHRCVLQRLASDLGRHPWFWKPISCWMHPLLLRPGKRPVLTLPDPADDPQAFTTRTHCGRSDPRGTRAAEVLREELAMLGRISGRDLVRELAG